MREQRQTANKRGWWTDDEEGGWEQGRSETTKTERRIGGRVKTQDSVGINEVKKTVEWDKQNQRERAKKNDLYASINICYLTEWTNQMHIHFTTAEKEQNFFFGRDLWM